MAQVLIGSNPFCATSKTSYYDPNNEINATTTGQRLRSRLDEAAWLSMETGLMCDFLASRFVSIRVINEGIPV